MIIANLGEAVHERKERFMRIFINPGHALGGAPAPGYKDRGVKAHPSFCVLRNTTMPAVLVETGFIDSEDVNLLTRHGDDIARALARGVTDYANFLASA